MNPKRNLTLILFVILALGVASAKIAAWDIAPKYEKLKRYSGEIYVFQQNGKFGLTTSGDKEILAASCDFITPFTNGYALAGTEEGNRYRLEYIINEDGNYTALSDKYYLPASCQYVSEGKLAVVDKNGKHGYLSTDGNVVIKCQFDKALPFKEGWAPVKEGNYTKYISENYDRNKAGSVLRVDFHYGEMTQASCFLNGNAVVAYNKDLAIIGKNGQKIRKINQTEYTQLYKKNNTPPTSPNSGVEATSQYEVFTRNGKSGLKGDQGLVLFPQFDSFPAQFSDDAVVAEYNGKFGILKIMDGDIDPSIPADEIDVDRKGNIPPVTVNFKIPESLSSVKVLVDAGDGTYSDMTSRLSDKKGDVSLSVTPAVSGNAESCTIKGKIENDGILLDGFEKTIALNYPVKLRLSAPGPSAIRANENNRATFSCTVFNDSNREVTVNATWSTGKTVSITLPAHGSRTVSDSITVSSDFAKEISLVLSTGERTRSIINFQTYF